MNLFRAIGVAGWAMRSALGCATRARSWVPFLLVAAAQLVSLGLLVGFGSGPPRWALPLFQWAGGAGAAHFPFLYLVLPVVLARWNLLTGVVLSSWTTAAAVGLFAASWGAGRREVAWSQAGRRYASLLLVGLVAAFLSLAVFGLGGLIPAQALLENRTLRWGTRGGLLLLFVALESLVVYGLAFVALRGRSWAGALRDSVRLAIRIPMTTFVVVATPVVLLYPLDYLLGRGDLFLGKLRPDLVIGVLVLRIVVETALSFVLVGSVTRLFLWGGEEKR